MRNMHLLYMALIILAIAWAAVPQGSEAASSRGTAAVVETGTELCTVLKELLDEKLIWERGEDRKVDRVVGIRGRLKGKVTVGQGVIIKTRTTGKIMAEVKGIYTGQKELEKMPADFFSEEADVIWCDPKKQKCILLKSRKAFVPSAGDVVKMKSRSGAARQVEGC
ncbi:MAG TPA: hypothetical protein EYP57_04470 [Thermodesulfobacteriaceae bacterium]|nr:hypothetical protein [Thermodesulfobacteriaceae bacterium]